MRRAKGVLIAASVLSVLSVTAWVIAGVPGGKETLKIDRIEGKKGAVEFPHAKHVDEYKKADGSAIGCRDCHHTAPEGTNQKNEHTVLCGQCHVKEGEPQKELGGKKAPFIATQKGDKIDKKSVIFHTTCLGCHKEVSKASEKNIKKCKACHQ